MSMIWSMNKENHCSNVICQVAMTIRVSSIQDVQRHFDIVEILHWSIYVTKDAFHSFKR